ncbi:MAG: hypothetical protein ACI30J_02525 [Paludibacteraceae bacterium]
MKKVFLLCLCFATSVAAMAQISTGEPHSSVIPRTGNRPQKGDWGVYIGGSVSQIMDLVNYCQTKGAEGAYGLPLVNLKYYCTDNWEFRMGFQFAARTKSTKSISGSEESTMVQKTFEGSDYTRLLPGVAYHFSPANILDVYVGAQLPIGFNSSVTRGSLVAGSSTNKAVTRQGAFVIGGGLFLGLQFFIADLPFAIGVEGGYSGLVIAESVPRTTVQNEGYKQTMREGTANTTAQWGADAALTFSYYFH